MTTTRDELIARFAPVLDRIRESARAHETERSLPYEEVRRLAEAGFGALRVPAAEDGGGVGLADFFALLVQLGAADSNQPQIWRNHIAFVEDRLMAEPAEQNRRWRKVLAGGAVIGGAWSEKGPQAFGRSGTRLGPDRLLNGTKHYSTGSIFADWIHVFAKRDEDDVIAVVDAHHPGVRLDDDWAGVGQRLTGSGTTVFTDVPVAEGDVFTFTQRSPYQEAVYQLVLLAALAGIGRAAQRDLVTTLQNRTRAYPQGLGDVPRADPQLQAVVGRVSALAASAEAAVARAARALEEAADASLAVPPDGPDDPDVLAALHAAAVAVYEAQITVTDDVLAATTLIYDGLGSSAVEAGTLLDRHWRNARTVTSHNPRVYKERIVGDWYLNGAAPVVFAGSKES